MGKILFSISKTNWFKSIIVIVVSIIIYAIIKRIVTKVLYKGKEHLENHSQRATFIKLFNDVIKYLFIVIVLLIILEINGINITSLAAGLGITGIIVGLAVQDALKDIIMGANIIAEKYFKVGDVVKYNDITGKVLSVGLKTTKLRDIYTNNLVFISNRNIDKIINVSNWLDINMPASYDDKIKDVENTIQKAISNIKTFHNVEDCKYMGLDSIDPSSIVYKVRIFCKPEFVPQLKRDSLKCLKKAFDDDHITMPYQQIDIHQVK